MMFGYVPLFCDLFESNSMQFGNNRGNKYSKKSIHHSPTSTAFWDFSMDEFAFHDIPNSIDYILSTTNQPSLSYIGFSQGTAQAFATLSIHPKLNDKVNVFIALAPAMSPAGLSNGIVDSMMKASPQVLFLLFGRRSILSSATMWQSILYPPIFVRAIDISLSFLFNWQAKNISMSQKLAAYPHLYSFTSTKSVVHWFQIIRTKSFQMFDDEPATPPILGGGASKYTRVARFPTRNIKTPCVLVYGGSDSLVDIEVMLKQLPRHTVATEIPHYEHLDFLWARDVDKLVFPHVVDALESFLDSGHSKEDFAKYRAARDVSLGPSMGSSYADIVASPNIGVSRNSKASGIETVPVGRQRTGEETGSVDSSASSMTQPTNFEPARATEEQRRPASMPVHTLSDADEGNLGSKTFVAQSRKNRKGSNVSFDSTLRGSFKRGGISLGAARPVGGLSFGSSGGWEAVGSGTDTDRERERDGKGSRSECGEKKKS